jgi:hypothetical protein
MLPVLAGALVVTLTWVGVARTGGGGAIAVGVVVTVVAVAAALAGAAWQGVKLSLAVPVAVIEGEGPLSALRRSKKLVKGAWWRTFGITLLAGVALAVVNRVIQTPFSFTSGFTSGDTGAQSQAFADLPFLFVGLLITMVVGLAGQLLQQIVLGMLYIDRRIRTEGLATHLAAAAGVDLSQAPVPPQSPMQPPMQPPTA